jgi:hypothetical protein
MGSSARGQYGSDRGQTEIGLMKDVSYDSTAGFNITLSLRIHEPNLNAKS